MKISLIVAGNMMCKILNWLKRKLDLVTVDPFYLEPKDFFMKNATIVETSNGFALKTGNQIVSVYSRARDARRGAKRRGLNLV